MKSLDIFTPILLCVCTSARDSLCSDSSLCHTSVFIVTAGQLKGAEMV